MKKLRSCRMGFHDWRPYRSVFPEFRSCQQCGLTQVFWAPQSLGSRWVDVRIVVVGKYKNMGNW